MTTETPTPGPVLLTRGRFAITAMPDGSWVLAHAGPLCETCQACGCGEQQQPIGIPAMLVGLMKAHAEGRRPGLGQLRKLAAMAAGHLGAGGDLEAGPDDGS